MNKIQAAIELLQENKGFQLGDVRLEMTGSGELDVIGWSQYLNIGNITRATALPELEETRTIFFKMVESYPELKRFIEGKELIFSLWYDDGGGSVSVCSEKNGIIRWDLLRLKDQ